METEYDIYNKVNNINNNLYSTILIIIYIVQLMKRKKIDKKMLQWNKDIIEKMMKYL